MKKHIFETALLLGLIFSVLTAALAAETQDNLSKKMIRLHIIAHSDSEADQATKLKVRDAVLSKMEKLTRDCADISETRTVIYENLGLFEDIANEICRKEDLLYSAKAELSQSHFPTREYETFTLPAGRYEALKIKLGKASGKNWWCVLFPPLCVSAAESVEEFESFGLSEKEAKFITSEKTEFKFKLLEILDHVL